MDDRASDPRHDTTASDGPSWLTLDGETLRWRGRPRIQTALPGVVGGLAVAVVGVGLGLGGGGRLGPTPVPVPAGSGSSLVAVGALVVGVLLAASAYLGVRNTEYAATDSALYRKQGVLSRTVTAVDYRTVQNVRYSQGVAGTVLGYGTLTFDTAGSAGTELSFSNLEDPRGVERLVDDQLARARHGATGESPVPGRTEQWEAVLEEVRSIRRSLESGRRG